ncbi:MAG: LPS export ABC transporter ATP-binding protein [Gammaproteobacteria bacterium]|nr:LPS export ABC transporter ATP-binding protein [Gammaproteobacteria bacterium]MBT5054112.1 LPS export ABC transporter ATP-binding protein [Gammaproteobacteria bacterium]
MASQLSVQHLRKQFGNRPVVTDVSFHVDAGEVVGLLGPNGAGKTTCFYMIAGLVQPDLGEINLAGTSITTLPMHQRAALGLGYLPQEASIFRKLSVADNLLAIFESVTDLTHSERLERTNALLAEFNLNHVRGSLGLALSGGERRRAEIARALATDPKFLLLDEPFAGVDPISVGDIKNIINYLAQRGIGILITDHNVRETLDICQRAYIVNEGQLIAQGSSAEILDNELVKSVYLGENFRL